MKLPKLAHGIAVAITLSILAIAVYAVMSIFGVGIATVKVVIGVVTFAYIIWIFRRRERSCGQCIGGLGTLAAIVTAFLWGSLAQFAVLCVVIIWLIRSFAAYSSIVAALFDGLLSFVSLGAAVWALTVSGSLIAAIWCFFLGQALFVFIPKSLARSANNSSEPSEDYSNSAHRFAKAHRAAELALQELFVRG